MFKTYSELGKKDKSVARRIYLLVLLVYGVYTGGCWADVQTVSVKPDPVARQYVSISPTEDKVILSPSPELVDCTSKVSLSKTRDLFACREASIKPRADKSLHVFLMDTTSDKPKILSKTRGAGDAYSLRLELRSNPDARFPTVLIAAASAEYAYGASLYFIRNDVLVYVGEIDYVLLDTKQNPITSVDHMNLIATDNGFKIVFNKDVFELSRNGEYKARRANDAELWFDGKRLRHKMK